MNISPLTIYLWQLADTLKGGLIPISTLSCIATIIGAVYFVTTRAEPCKDEDDQKRHSKVSARMFFAPLFVFTTSWLGCVVVPSSNTVAMMVVIPEIAKSKVMQQDLPDIYNAAVKALKDQLTK